MDIEYTDLISKALAEVETETAREILNRVLSTPPSLDLPLETLSAIIKYGFSNVFPFSYIFKSLLAALFIAIILDLFKDCFKNQTVFRGIKYFFTLSLTSVTVLPAYKLISNAYAYMRDISTFLGIAFPTLGILTASGGNVVTAKAQTFFFSILLTAVQLILNFIVPYVSAFLFAITVIDAFLGDGKLVYIANFVRTTFQGIFTISVSLFYIALNAYGQASKGADAISARALRLLVGNAIPIVGGTIGESLRFVSSGIVNIKNAIGISAVVFILALFLPILLSLWGSGLVLNLLNCFADYFNMGGIKSTVVYIKHLIDFALASFSVIAVASIINVNAFLSVTPTYLL